MLGDRGFVSVSGDSEQYSSQNHVKVLTRHEKSRYLAPTNKRITLNVSGTRYETYEETLNNFPETLLGCSQKREEYFNESTQEYVLPRSKCAFDSILFYYQSRGILARPKTITIKDFDDELQFYQITNPDPLAGLLREDVAGEQPVPVATNFRERMWLVLEYPHSSRLGQLVALLSVFVILFSIVIFCIETLKVLKKRRESDFWFTLETLCIAWFIGEYLCRLYSAPVRWKFVFSMMGIVDFLAILPYLVTLPFKEELDDVRSFLVMRALRLFRVLRVFKLSRYSVGFKILLHTIVDSLDQMRTICFCTAIAVLIFGSVVFFAEGSSGQFSSIPQSMWWALQTMSSVGYGDIVPVTPMGRFIGSVCALSGILLFCLPTPILVSNFLKHYTRAFVSASSHDSLGEQQKRLVENMKKIYLSTSR